MRRGTAGNGRDRRALLALAVVAALLAGVAGSVLRSRRNWLPLPDVGPAPAPAAAAPPAPAPTAAPAAAAAAAAPPADALHEPVAALMALTRDELYARARERGVTGRSRMTKRQLAEALAPDG